MTVQLDSDDEIEHLASDATHATVDRKGDLAFRIVIRGAEVDLVIDTGVDPDTGQWYFATTRHLINSSEFWRVMRSIR